MTPKEKNDAISDLMHRLDAIEMEIKSLRTQEKDEAEAFELKMAIYQVNSATESLRGCWDQALAIQGMKKEEKSRNEAWDLGFKCGNENGDRLDNPYILFSTNSDNWLMGYDASSQKSNEPKPICPKCGSECEFTHGKINVMKPDSDPVHGIDCKNCSFWAISNQPTYTIAFELGRKEKPQ